MCASIKFFRRLA